METCEVCGRTAAEEKHPCRFAVCCSCWRGVPCKESTTKSYHSEEPTQCEDCLRWRPRRLIWTFSVGIGTEMRTVHAHCKSCDGWCEDFADDTPDECLGTYDGELTAAELRELEA